MSSNNNQNYDVGYGKPPKNTQFKKGESGNNRGRPSKIKNTLTILTSELDKTVVLKENGKEIKLTKRQAMLRHMVNKAVQGDSKAMFFVFNQLLQLDQKEELKAQVSKIFLEEDQEILKRFLQENSSQNSDNNNNF